jgi:cyclic beta-1,2-glucan synthetase
VVVRASSRFERPRGEESAFGAFALEDLDNLRRSLLEISVLLLLLAGWLSPRIPRWTLAVLLLLQLPAYADMLLSIIRAPERRFWKAFSKAAGRTFPRKPSRYSAQPGLHSASSLPDGRRHRSHAVARISVERTCWNGRPWRNPRLWAGPRFSLFDQYLYISSLVWLPFIFLAGPLPIVVAADLRSLDHRALVVGWLNEPLPKAAAITPKDREFLRETALRTWRYFADHSWEEQHWLVPDNVQENPPLVTHHISPTNLGLSLTAQLAAHDFGYLNLDELSNSLQRILHSLEGNAALSWAFLQLV